MNKLFQLTIFIMAFLIVTPVNAVELQPFKAKKIKSLAHDVQKKAPDDTDYFEDAFPHPEEIKDNEKKTGSLWVDTYSSRFYNNLHRASRVGDMVTILIEESASGTKSASTKTEKKTSDLLSITGLFGLLSKITSGISGLDPEKVIEGKHENKLDGKGETKRKGELQAKLAARVVKVLKNGDMMIRGQKNIKVNGEEQSLIVEGFIRPYDIDSDNTIMSTFVADARITFSGFGVVSEKQKPGWLTRIMDKISPF